ncbi:hypothetical protein BS329_15445 [Amycolatopsis coloradensis]|uniref:Uncharacterized protein n=1 Tax=Amycolatopsis coloradensis TaxID=76021 RepID=A0A1R0KU55_9PSEU|nr:hypothetical protein [Amycolatopsis coloradensis]OLZ51659.1 hypothetical protein BS329_15445 [Amycolatopsis coloradensis]
MLDTAAASDRAAATAGGQDLSTMTSDELLRERAELDADEALASQVAPANEGWLDEIGAQRWAIQRRLLDLGWRKGSSE